ncbi:efflux RND transporter periplasmic adaptor subunit [Bacillus suaedaesalsae]|uniref:Efflux RND transporter periplasmic adaptor subunit n=1 Tax=Bacillus suaedaesalsae TaxID=2810349 RepID=A0ABS2DKE8_9BACI|nr:efflux RND transporter periplasmic adaptor subunit [Bacillus suaedaesalsae]
MKKIWIAVGIILVITVFIGINIVKSYQSTHFKVETAILEEKELKSTVMIPGSLALENEQIIYYAPENGEVSEIVVEEGKNVEAGTPLFTYVNEQFTIEQEKHNLMIESSYLQINSLKDKEARVKENEKELAKQLGKKEAAKQVEPELEQLEVERKLANLDLKQLLLQKDLYEKQKNNLKVKSDINGTVLKINEKVIKNKQSTSPFIHIANLSQFVISGVLSEYDALKIEKGMKVEITSDAIPDKTWNGTVHFVSAIPENQQSGIESSGNEVVQYPIEVTIENPSPLKPGFQLIMEIETEKKKAHVLPIDAVIQDGKKEFVYIVKDGKTSKREVKTGSSQDAFIEIVDGVKEEENVIVSPHAKLKDGSEVTIR